MTMRLGLTTRTRLLAPDSANCPALVNGVVEPPTMVSVTPVMPVTTAPSGTVMIPVVDTTELPPGSVVLSTATSRVAVVVVSTLATTCAGRRLGRLLTWSSRGLFQVGFAVMTTELAAAWPMDDWASLFRYCVCGRSSWVSGVADLLAPPKL